VPPEIVAVEVIVPDRVAPATIGVVNVLLVRICSLVVPTTAPVAP
jgi:hypothetical protein